MTLLGLIIVVIIAVILLKESNTEKRYSEEECREIRTEIPFRFSNGITKEKFIEIAEEAGRRIDRVTELSVSGPIVYGTVESITTISEWNFKIDFNDFGRITGSYWLTSDNEDSMIPERVADIMSSMIVELLEEKRTDYEYDYESSTRNERITEYKQKSRQETLTRIKKVLKIVGIVFLIMMLISAVSSIGSFVVYKYQEYKKSIPVGISSDYIIGKDYKKIEKKLEKNGFQHVISTPNYDLKYKDKDEINTVASVKIGEKEEFKKNKKFPYDTDIYIEYHDLKKATIPVSYKEAKKLDHNELEDLLAKEGFVNINVEEDKDLTVGLLSKEGRVKSVRINGEKEFEKGDRVKIDADIIITYHAFK